MTGSRESPRSCLRSSVRCSSFITSRVTLTAPVPGTSATACGDPFGDLGLLRAGRGGQVDLDVHAVVGVDGDVLDHAELGDRSAQFGVDHLGQRGADRGFQVSAVFADITAESRRDASGPIRVQRAARRGPVRQAGLARVRRCPRSGRAGAGPGGASLGGGAEFGQRRPRDRRVPAAARPRAGGSASGGSCGWTAAGGFVPRQNTAQFCCGGCGIHGGMLAAGPGCIRLRRCGRRRPGSGPNIWLATSVRPSRRPAASRPAGRRRAGRGRSAAARARGPR